MSLTRPEGEEVTIEQLGSSPKSTTGQRVEKSQVEIHTDSKGNDLPDIPGLDEAFDIAEGKTKPVEKKEEAPVVEQKEEPVAEEKPVVESKEEPAKEEEVPESELRVLPHDKESTRKRIDAFLKKEAKLKEELAARDSKLAELEKRPVANADEIAKIKEEYEKTKGDLLKYRRRYEIDNDPEIAEKFSKPIEEAESNIANTLNKYGISETTMKAIKDAGGLASFSRSNKVYVVNEPDPDTGEVKKVEKTAGTLVNSWLGSMNPADAEYVRSNLGKRFNLEDAKVKFIQDETSKASEYFKQIEEARKQAEENQVKDITEKKAQWRKWAEETVSKEEWLKEKEVPASAPEETKKLLHEYNEIVKSARTTLVDPAPILTPDTIRSTLANAIRTPLLEREIAQLKKELAETKANAERLKTSTRTTTARSGGLLAKAASSPKKEESSTDTSWDSIERALEASLNKS